VTAVYAFYQNVQPIVVASLLCLCTSVCHHSLKEPSKKLRLLDIVVVNSIGCYFLIDCYLTIPLCHETRIVYLCAIGAFLQYTYQQRTINATFGKKYHWLIHIMANAALGIYVFVKQQQHNNLRVKEL